MFLYSLIQLVNSFLDGYDAGFGAIMALFGSVPAFYTARNSLFLWGHVFPEIGVIARFIGLTVILVSVCLLFAFRKPWSSVKGKIGLGIFLEGLFFFCFLGSVPMLLDGINAVFAVSYFIQVFLAAPVLMALSWKIRNSNAVSDGLDGLPWKFLSLTLLCYVATIWVNSISRWISTMMNSGIASLFTLASTVGFLNALIILSCSLGFTIAGVLTLYRHKALLAIKLFALSLTFVGLYFLIFLVNTFATSSLSSAYRLAMLMEIWATPLLGLGLSMFMYH
jgi:hypothetical protein